MRIFYAVGNQKEGVDPFKDPGSWIDREFYPTLSDMGHDLVRFKWDMPGFRDLEDWRKNEVPVKNKDLVKEIKKAHREEKIDLFLSAFDGRVMFPETIKAVKALGIPTVNYHCDDINAFHFNEHMVGLYDYNWTFEKRAIDSYKNLDAKYIYTPYGANPKTYKPYDVKKEFDVTFIGRSMGYREELIQYLLRANIDVRVWGFDWVRYPKDLPRHFAAIPIRHRPRGIKRQAEISSWYLRNLKRLPEIFGPTLTHEEMVTMYSRSRINLNFSGGWGPLMSDFSRAKRSMKFRDMEVPMSGAFYMTEYSDEMAELFEIGKEIECYKSKEELLEKVQYYLERPEKADAIGKAAREKAVSEYTWEKIFTRLFTEIGLV